MTRVVRHTCVFVCLCVSAWAMHVSRSRLALLQSPQLDPSNLKQGLFLSSFACLSPAARVCVCVCFGAASDHPLLSPPPLVLLAFGTKGARPGKQVQLLETEIKMLCVKARDIFMQQPILLELEAPIKICGELSHYSYHTFLRIVQ